MIPPEPPTSTHCPGALLHLPGFGPRKIADLRQRGLDSWPRLLDHHGDLPGLDETAPPWVKAVRVGCEALARADLTRLVTTFHRSDHWRILADFLPQATYLDIETSGDTRHPDLTLIIALHRGHLHTFTAEQNLDAFLDLLDDLTLLVTFNGASFDVPQLENHFHLPLHDLAHIDLRWVCYHRNLRGGLKEIERAIGLQRPPDLVGMDGAEADWLWRQWKESGRRGLLDRLTRYCAADVLGLEHLARWLIADHTGQPVPTYSWDALPPPPADLPAPSAPAPAPPSVIPPPAPFPRLTNADLQRLLRERLRAGDP
jgi:uncharacterized protein YprB with RNaseH-like and TPR domain